MLCINIHWSFTESNSIDPDVRGVDPESITANPPNRFVGLLVLTVIRLVPIFNSDDDTFEYDAVPNTFKLPLIVTFWFKVLTNEAVLANEADVAVSILPLIDPVIPTASIWPVGTRNLFVNGLYVMLLFWPMVVLPPEDNNATR